MLNLIKPRHHSLIKKTPKAEHVQRDREEEDTQASSPPKKAHFFKKVHRNATRTRVTQFLEYKSNKIKTIQHPSLWLLSKTYLKRLEVRSDVGIEKDKSEGRRKISWSQESQYIYFNERKNSASVSEASRHIYTLDE